MSEHELKILPDYLSAIANGRKRFEIRRNDRNFSVGDVLVLNEWQPGSGYTGLSIPVVVTYMTDFAQRDGYIVMGIELDYRK